MNRTTRWLAVATVALAGLGATGAQAFTCSVEGSGGEFEVKRIDTGPGFRRLSLQVEVDKAFGPVADDSNWHLFGGMWFIEADTGVASYIFGGQNSYGPPQVAAEVEGQRVDVEVVTNGLLQREFSAGVIHPDAQPNETYYLVGFGTGSGTWKGTVGLVGSELDCSLVDVDGEVFDYDASDFQGGTHVMVPGFGHGEDIVLHHHNPRIFSIGALFAHMPEPLPPTSVRVQNEDADRLITQDMVQIGGWSRHEWTFTANYTGQPEDAPLIRLLQLDLDIGR